MWMTIPRATIKEAPVCIDTGAMTGFRGQDGQYLLLTGGAEFRATKAEKIEVDIQREEVDILRVFGVPEYQCLDHGFVVLRDMMPRMVWRSADDAVVEAARVSFGKGLKYDTEDRALIRYLMSHAHTTPFEMVEYKFYMTMPLFVARQWIRHRNASVNEYSARYSKVKEVFYKPTVIRGQDNVNKQGSAGSVDMLADFNAYLSAAEDLYSMYEKLVEGGVSKELARIALPLNLYTEWYWKCDLHNILHLIGLRSDSHAQQEIREYSDALLDVVRITAPWTYEAFMDYRKNAMRLSAQEIKGAVLGNDREEAAYQEKRRLLGLC